MHHQIQGECVGLLSLSETFSLVFIYQLTHSHPGIRIPAFPHSKRSSHGSLAHAAQDKKGL